MICREEMKLLVENGVLLEHLPYHTCYVEVFFTGLRRLFAKRPSLVEVINDHSEASVVNLVRQVKNASAHLLASLTQQPKGEKPGCEARLYGEILLQWYTRFPSSEDIPGMPRSVDELRSAFYGPYCRMRTVIWEDLEWSRLMQRYDDSRTVQIIEPPWPDDDWNQFSSLALRLSDALCHWAVSIPDTQLMRDLFWPLTQPSSVVEGWNSDRILLTNFAFQQSTGVKQHIEQKEHI